MFRMSFAALLICSLTISPKAMAQADSIIAYRNKIISYYHNHRNYDVYTNFMAMRSMQGYAYDSTVAKMVVMSGIRLLQSNTKPIEHQPLLELLTPLIEKDKRWLHFRADIYGSLSRNLKGSDAAKYANLKQTDMLEYDNRYRPYEYNVLIP